MILVSIAGFAVCLNWPNGPWYGFCTFGSSPDCKIGVIVNGDKIYLDQNNDGRATPDELFNHCAERKLRTANGDTSYSICNIQSVDFSLGIWKKRTLLIDAESNVKYSQLGNLVLSRIREHGGTCHFFAPLELSPLVLPDSYLTIAQDNLIRFVVQSTIVL